MQMAQANHQHWHLFLSVVTRIHVCGLINEKFSKEVSKDIIEARYHLSWKIVELIVELPVKLSDVSAIDFEYLLVLGLQML